MFKEYDEVNVFLITVYGRANAETLSRRELSYIVNNMAQYSYEHIKDLRVVNKYSFGDLALILNKLIDRSGKLFRSKKIQYRYRYLYLYFISKYPLYFKKDLFRVKTINIDRISLDVIKTGLYNAKYLTRVDGG